MRYILLVVLLFCGLYANDVKFVGSVPFGSSSLRLEASTTLTKNNIRIHRKNPKEIYIDILGRLTFSNKDYKFANHSSITLTQHNKHTLRITIKLTKTTSYEYRLSGKYFYIEIKDELASPALKAKNAAATIEANKKEKGEQEKLNKEKINKEKLHKEKAKQNNLTKEKEKAHLKKEQDSAQKAKKEELKKAEIKKSEAHKTLPHKAEPKKLEIKKPEIKKEQAKKQESTSTKDTHKHESHSHEVPRKPVYITPLSAQFAKELNTFAHDKPILVSKATLRDNEKLPQGFKKKVIVIDPGHGGKDCGTFGIDKVCEKVIVLAIGKKLARILDRLGYVVYMTRDSDVFIDLRRRTEMANEIKADLFVSIHANSIPKGKPDTPKGIETYFLSTARTERALAVADIENQGDTATMNYFSKSYFLSTINSQRLVASNKLAIDIQFGALKSVRTKYKDVVDGGVREGPFWVLAGALMPSVLIETGYNSNPIEAPRLIDSGYQELLAIGIANGIRSYFAKNP
ncbi:N-acetylmuramoyl-L-alanine amidase [Helicobacter sp. 11S02629-2]|uniref:N-acetylmuramoyl-L-alanine amidase family protein n=1 Tax=Helicobacter sp. 11S02629-2 TaxID=1476195 RepID=UPI000BA53819|nr:N-acetylmuramoyl-L-alanine amidase [Helicobacter sp. 11S02629-2]PAF45281.1 hypothetical protein BKH40_03530 [Helicobacter sp. 11S02629-2]